VAEFFMRQHPSHKTHAHLFPKIVPKKWRKKAKEKVDNSDGDHGGRFDIFCFMIALSIH